MTIDFANILENCALRTLEIAFRFINLSRHSVLITKYPDFTFSKGWTACTVLFSGCQKRVYENYYRNKIACELWAFREVLEVGRKRRARAPWWSLLIMADKCWAVKRALRSSFNVWCGVGLARALFPRFQCAWRPAKFSFLQTGNPIFFL